MKTCSKCGESKPLEAYPKRKEMRDGHRAECKACRNAYSDKWRSVNKQRQANTHREWKAKNPGRMAAIHKMWRESNPNKRVASNHRYRARLSSNSVNMVSAKEIADISALPCYACGTHGPSQVDHIIPLIRGGAHSIGNLIPLCGSCNQSKRDLLYIEWKYSQRPQAQKAFASP